MKNSRYSDSQIVAILAEEEPRLAVWDVCRKHGISNAACYQCVEWHPKLSHFEENLHPNLSHPNRLSCLIFEQGWARRDQRGNFEQITQTCPSRQGLRPTS
jgi:hypothetical protein